MLYRLLLKLNWGSATCPVKRVPQCGRINRSLTFRFPDQALPPKWKRGMAIERRTAILSATIASGGVITSPCWQI